jgi:uncharacterized membrane protein
MTRWITVSALLALAAFAGAWYVYRFQYDNLLDPVPVHWDAHLRPDAWVAKDEFWKYLLILPCVMAGWVLLTLALPWLSPKPFDVDRFRTTYAYVMALAQLLFGYLSVVVFLAGLKSMQPFRFGEYLCGGLFLFFALIGNVTGRLRRNFWMGVRTPWTLANETVWIQTHRFTAWLWTGFGLAGFMTVLLGVPLLIPLCLVVVIAFVPIVYSFVVYRRLERQGRLGDAGTSQLPADGVHGP